MIKTNSSKPEINEYFIIALYNKGYNKLTAIQVKVILLAMNGRDVLG